MIEGKIIQIYSSFSNIGWGGIVGMAFITGACKRAYATAVSVVAMRSDMTNKQDHLSLARIKEEIYMRDKLCPLINNIFQRCFIKFSCKVRSNS